LLFFRTINSFTIEIKKDHIPFSIPKFSANPVCMLASFWNLCLSGDDWEHEETFTDDDETLDIDIEERPDLVDPEAAPPEIKQVNRDMMCLLQYTSSKLFTTSADAPTLTRTTLIDAISDFYHNTHRMTTRMN